MKDIIKKIKKANMVFTAGNGGSASTAEHLSNDLFSKGIPTMCLNSNGSIMTMIANDFGYVYTFSRQLKVLGSSNDLLITISCSGDSINIINAVDVAEDMKMPVIEFEAFKKDRNYEKLEDKHLQMVHKIKEAL